MAENKIENNTPEPLTEEQFEKLSTELWKTFEHCSGKQGYDTNKCHTAATVALAIIQLQTVKPPGL